MTGNPATGGSRSSWDRDTLPEGDDKREAVREMFDAIAPRYDLVNRIMTFGLDVRWRRRTLAHMALAKGSVVLDLAAGTGDLSRDLVRAGHVAISVDLSHGMLAHDRSGVPRMQADICNLPVADGSVDGAVCGFALRNLVGLPAFFSELARVVRPGGRIALLDVAVPTNRFVAAGNSIYFGRIVPRIGALLSDGPAYRYLPRSVSYLPAPEVLAAAVVAAGFPDAVHRHLSGGLVQSICATRASR